MIINKTLRPSSRLKVKLMILVCTCIAGFTTSWYKLSFVNHMDKNVTGLHLPGFFITVYFWELPWCYSTIPTEMSTHTTFILLQSQWLYSSLSKLRHQGTIFYFVLKVFRQQWKCHCAYAPLYYVALHIYFTGDECVTIWKVISLRWFTRKRAEPRAAGVSGPIWQPGGSFMSPVRTEMASCVTFAESYWSCCQRGSRTATTACHNSGLRKPYKGCSVWTHSTQQVMIGAIEESTLWELSRK